MQAQNSLQIRSESKSLRCDGRHRIRAWRNFDEYAQVSETCSEQDNDRIAEKPWGNLSIADKVPGNLFDPSPPQAHHKPLWTRTSSFLTDYRECTLHFNFS